MLANATEFLDPEGSYSVLLDVSGLPPLEVVDGTEAWVFDRPVDGLASVLSIEAGPVPEGMDFDDYHEFQLESARVFVEDLVVIRAETRAGHGGERLSLLDLQSTADGKALQVETVTVVRSGIAVTATLSAPRDDFEALREKIEPYMLTLTSRS